MKKRLLYLALALIAAPLLWGQSTVVCTTASPGTVIGSCASGVTSPVTTDPVSATGVWTFNNAANTPVTAADGVIDSTLTATRVTFAGAAGRLSDDADMTFATDTLTATKAVGSTSVCGGGATDAANSVCVTGNTVTGEGATADASETVLAFGDASADNTLTLKGTASGVEATVTTGALLTGAGTGTGRVSVGGVLCKGAGSAPGSTSEEVLATCTIPANTLTAVGSGLRVVMNWTTAANANNKTISLRLGGIGGVVLWTSGAVAWNNQRVLQLTGPLIISYESSTTGTAGGQVTGVASGGGASGTSANYGKTFTGIDWTTSQALVITKTTPTAASDASLQLYLVEVVQ